LPVAHSFGDAIVMTSLAAVLLNGYFNRTTEGQAADVPMLAAQGARHD
jgi:hypothetical protein